LISDKIVNKGSAERGLLSQFSNLEFKFEVSTLGGKERRAES
jgi:hypothetical protein